MKKMNKIVSIFFYLLIVTSCQKNIFEQNLKTIFQEADFNGEFNQTSFSSTPFILIGESKNGEKIKIRNFIFKNDNELMNSIKRVITLYDSQFVFSVAPYPGQITTEIECGSNYKPKKLILKSFTAIRYFSNSRLGLAICNNDKKNYAQYLFFIKASENNVLAIDLYLEKEVSTEELLERIGHLKLNGKVITF